MTQSGQAPSIRDFGLPAAESPLMRLTFRTPMRSPIVLCVAALAAGTVFCSTVYAEGNTAAAVKMTVTAHDKDAIHAVSLQLAANGQAVALAIATTGASLADVSVNASTTYSVSTTRTGALTATQVDDVQAQCRNYAVRPGMRCTIEITYGAL